MRLWVQAHQVVVIFDRFVAVLQAAGGQFFA